MCARMTLTIETIEEIADTLDAEVAADDARRHRRRYNVAPSDTHWVLEYGADRRILRPAHWGYLPTSPPTRPNKLISVIHDRMPVIVPEGRVDDWLTAPPAEAASLITPAPEDALIATPVSRRVNSVKNDDAACLAAPQPDAQGSLF